MTTLCLVLVGCFAAALLGLACADNYAELAKLRREVVMLRHFTGMPRRTTLERLRISMWRVRCHLCCLHPRGETPEWRDQVTSWHRRLVELDAEVVLAILGDAPPALKGENHRELSRRFEEAPSEP